MPSEGSWRWFPAFLVDLPFSLLLIELPESVPPLVVYGVLGSLWWYLIALLIIKGFNKLKKNKADENYEMNKHRDQV
jgi:hypothetical protein